MSLITVLYRLARGYARGRAERSRLDEGRSWTSGADGPPAEFAGDAAEFHPEDETGAADEDSRRRTESEGTAHARALAYMFADLGGTLGRADSVGSLFEQAKRHTMGVVEEMKAQMLIQAMILAAKADGEISAAERDRILGHLDDHASEEEIAFVVTEMETRRSLRSFLRSLPPDEGFRREVYAVSCLAIDIDADTVAERAHLEKLAKGLKLDAGDVARIEDRLRRTGSI